MEHDAPTILWPNSTRRRIPDADPAHHTPFGAFISDALCNASPAQRDGLLQAVREATTEQFQKAAQIETGAIDELKAKA